MSPNEGGSMSTDPNGTGDTSGVDYEVSSDDRTWGILAHASAFIGFILPLGNIIAPLLIWVIKKEDSRFVDENGRNAVNFQISWTIYLIVAALSILLLIGILLVPILLLAWLILVILATIRASNNEVYEYPLTINLIS